MSTELPQFLHVTEQGNLSLARLMQEEIIWRPSENMISRTRIPPAALARRQAARLTEAEGCDITNETPRSQETTESASYGSLNWSKGQHVLLLSVYFDGWKMH